MRFLALLLMLFAGHAVCDYPLQGEFLAKGKNHKSPIPGISWWQCLTAHALIHAGMVTLITGIPLIGLAEFILHWATDWIKCDGQLTFNEDQSLHYLCKVVWAIVVMAVVLKG